MSGCNTGGEAEGRRKGTNLLAKGTFLVSRDRDGVWNSPPQQGCPTNAWAGRSSGTERGGRDRQVSVGTSRDAPLASSACALLDSGFLDRLASSVTEDVTDTFNPISQPPEPANRCAPLNPLVQTYSAASIYGQEGRAP